MSTTGEPSIEAAERLQGRTGEDVRKRYFAVRTYPIFRRSI